MNHATANEQEFFFLAAPQREALARLEHVVESDRGLCRLEGVAGVGKTRLLQHFARRRSLLGDVVWQGNGAKLHQTSALLCSLLQAVGRYDLTATDGGWLALARELQEMECDGLRFVVCLDNIHRANADILAFLSALNGLPGVSRKSLTIVLSGQRPARGGSQNGLLHEGDLLAELFPWEPTEVARMAAEFLKQMCRSSISLSPGAVQALVRLSGGLPGEACRMLQRLLKDRNSLPGVVHRDEILRAATCELMRAA